MDNIEIAKLLILVIPAKESAESNGTRQEAFDLKKIEGKLIDLLVK